MPKEERPDCDEVVCGKGYQTAKDGWKHAEDEQKKAQTAVLEKTDTITELSAELDELRSLEPQWEEEKEQLLVINEGLYSEIVGLKSEIVDLKSEIEGRELNNEPLNSDVTDGDEVNVDLKTIIELNKEIVELKKEIVKLNKEQEVSLALCNESRTDEIKRHKDEVKKHKDEVNKLSANIVDLSTQNISLTGKNNEVETRLTRMEHMQNLIALAPDAVPDGSEDDSHGHSLFDELNEVADISEHTSHLDQSSPTDTPDVAVTSTRARDALEVSMAATMAGIIDTSSVQPAKTSSVQPAKTVDVSSPYWGKGWLGMPGTNGGGRKTKTKHRSLRARRKTKTKHRSLRARRKTKTKYRSLRARRKTKTKYRSLRVRRKKTKTKQRTRGRL
jgi:hypothetical protein